MAELRKIIHIDMDAFFASVEQRDQPELKNKPIAVGGSGSRGVVAAASYEARKYGVKSAMSGRIAKQKCPDLIFVKPNFKKYKLVSMIIKSIFREYTDLIEPLSLDEAYLDVTHTKKGSPSATLIAQEIRNRILEQTDLTASAGISYCKFLAKIASDEKKPNGQFVITPDEAQAFINTLPITKFFGIGKSTADKFHKMGVYFGKDLKKYSLEDLTIRFGKSGQYFYNTCRGIDTRKVNPNRVRKSLGAERTFNTDLTLNELHPKISQIGNEVFKRKKKSNFVGKTITLKIKYNDFTQTTRSKTSTDTIEDLETILKTAIQLLEQDSLKSTVRLIGISLSNEIKEEKATQLTLKL